MRSVTSPPKSETPSAYANKTAEKWSNCRHYVPKDNVDAQPAALLLGFGKTATFHMFCKNSIYIILNYSKSHLLTLYLS